jgi:hydroxypyruvate isomerase
MSSSVDVMVRNMPRFTANIGFLFPERPFPERFAAARAAGFDAVECASPYDVPIHTLRDTMAAAGVRLSGINTPGGDRSKGEWGFAGVPGQELRFAADFDLALDYATQLGATMIHVMAGVVAAGSRADALAVYAANVRAAAEKAAESGIMLLLEPINARDAPGYLVSHCDELAGIIAAIGAPNVKLLFDAYHIQIMDGDLISRFERHRGVIGHVQVAGVPDRAEPDAANEVNFPAFFRMLDAIGYDGLIGAEYRPRGRTEDGLGWFKALSG